MVMINGIVRDLDYPPDCYSLHACTYIVRDSNYNRLNVVKYKTNSNFKSRSLAYVHVIMNYIIVFEDTFHYAVF